MPECLQLHFHQEHHCVCDYGFAGGKTGFENVSTDFGALHRRAASFLNYLMVASGSHLTGFQPGVIFWLVVTSLFGSTIPCFCCHHSSDLS